jgi:histidinol-phosphate aminotransferase
MFDLERLTRANIRRLQPYSTARHEFAGTADVWLDANENPFSPLVDSGLNRYPDPRQTELRQRLARAKGLSPAQVFVGNGSDEAIDLLFRIFCEPGADRTIICPPTYGMYRVAAEINDIAVDEVMLTREFQLDADGIRSASTPQTKLAFICSPNNPTGNSMSRPDILNVLSQCNGIVVIDEAYIDFVPELSFIPEIERFTNLVVLQTFSKAWGLAGARVGAAYADQRIVELLDRVKPPYNVSQLSQAAVLQALGQEGIVNNWRGQIINERRRLAETLQSFECIETVYPSDANFILVRVRDARLIYGLLLESGVVVRDRSTVALCDGCLRITVGSSLENDRLIEVLRQYETRETSI